MLRAKDSFDFFVLVHGNIPKLIVIQRGICFSYEYRFCLVDKCINYVFLKKIKCHKNRVGGTCSKYLLLLYSENNQFISYLPQPLAPLQYISVFQQDAIFVYVICMHLDTMLGTVAIDIKDE